MTPVAYTSSYEDARLLWSALRSSGITGKVRPVSVGAYPFALVVPGEVSEVAADLACILARGVVLIGNKSGMSLEWWNPDF